MTGKTNRFLIPVDGNDPDGNRAEFTNLLNMAIMFSGPRICKGAYLLEFRRATKAEIEEFEKEPDTPTESEATR